MDHMAPQRAPAEANPLDSVRLRLEERERLLSPFAANSFATRGRERPH